jgi:hypothetical protein
VHGDGKASVIAYIPYLRNYVESFRACKAPALDVKGKTSLASATLPSANPFHEGSMNPRWADPKEGSLKGNVDVGWDA